MRQRNIILWGTTCFTAAFVVWNSRFACQFSAMERGLRSGMDVPETVATETAATTTAAAATTTTNEGDSLSYFEQAADWAFDKIRDAEAAPHEQRPVFVLRQWKQRTTGGLLNPDRILLGKLYGQANSVFEFGLGESTFMADYLKVPRYAGIDSDPAWIAETRSKVSSHFRFYWADIGPTQAWGYPADASLPKNVRHYQLAPLVAEPAAFDVYMVDGRWRAALVLLCFLHASSSTSSTTAASKTTVLLHDCPQKGLSPYGMYQRRHRPVYDRIQTLLDLVDHSGNLLCVYQRKNTTTDKDLWELWKELHDVVE